MTKGREARKGRFGSASVRGGTSTTDWSEKKPEPSPFPLPVMLKSANQSQPGLALSVTSKNNLSHLSIRARETERNMMI